MAGGGLNLLCLKTQSSLLQPRVWMGCIYHIPRRTRLLTPQICVLIVSETVSDAELSSKLEILC